VEGRPASVSLQRGTLLVIETRASAADLTTRE
jgi:hypothetical protein